MKKKIIICVLIVAVTAVALIYSFAGKSGNEENAAETAQTEEMQMTEEAAEPTENTENAEIAVEMPTEEEAKAENSQSGTIIYIYSDSDSDRTGLEAMEKIKAEYEDRAAVNVMNINDEFVQMTGFALPDETPKLIVITDGGAFSQVPNCADEQTIRAEIGKIIG